MPLAHHLRALISNDVLWISILASSLAQFLKPFTYYLRTRELNWSMLAATGGMPSSHASLVSALAIGVGLREGFDSMFFAMSVVLAVIVVYDAQGVRHEAGEHARFINYLIAELLKGHPIQRIRLQEVLGHSRGEVVAGVLFGVTIMLLWILVIQPVVCATC